ncbi:MAG: hypothetical protein RLZZ210_1536 [Pseudomonadota bacterium]|jgi:thioester reductase-like protein
MKNLILTGCTGFLGSHLLVDWISKYPDAKILCIVRADDDKNAKQRILSSLERAIFEANLDYDANSCMKNIQAMIYDFKDISNSNQIELNNWVNNVDSFDVIHSAASLSFNENEKDMVWETNVIGTQNLIKMVTSSNKLTCFNYVSTAYVAGENDGYVPEANIETNSFKNTYEYSKWHAERNTINELSELNIPYRIFRPSIIIANSKTHRMKLLSGFYTVIDKLQKLSQGYNAFDYKVGILFNSHVCLNLINIDIVVSEMLAIINKGSPSYNHIYHLTNEKPIHLDDLFHYISSLSGIQLASHEESDNSLPAINQLVTRGIKSYLPYFIYNHDFCRKNVHKFSASHQSNNRLTVVKLHKLTKSFLESHSNKSSDKRNINSKYINSNVDSSDMNKSILNGINA